MSASTPAQIPRGRETFAAWNPQLRPNQTILLVPALHSPYHSLQAIQTLLDAVENLNPDVIVQTGSLLASDMSDPTGTTTTPPTDAIDLLIHDFFTPLSNIHKGRILIANRKSIIGPDVSLATIAHTLKHSAPSTILTALNNTWSIADNVRLASHPADVAGNYAVTVASRLQVSIISAYTGNQGKAQITRYGTHSNTVHGVELGTLADIRKCHNLPTAMPKNGYGVMNARDGHIELIKLSRRGSNAGRQSGI